MPWRVTDPDGTVHTFERQPENTKAVFVPAPTCSTCIHWRCDERARAAYGHRAVGTCSKGGPNPASGCSDSGAAETCERWAPDARKTT